MVRNVEMPTGSVITAPTHFGQRSIAGLDRSIDDTITAAPVSVDMDMGVVESVDSAGLNWLLAAQARLASSNIAMRLTNVRPLVEDILVATRLDGRLNIVIAERALDA